LALVVAALLMDPVLPSMVFTACRPYNATRKERKMPVICMISEFRIVSCGSNRETYL